MERLSAIAGSVVLHLLIVGLLFFTVWEERPPAQMPAYKPIIQARAVDESTAMAAVTAREAEEQRQRKEAEQQRKMVEAERQRQVEEKRKQAEAEKQRQAALKRKQLEEEKNRKEAEKKRLAEEQRKKDELERKQKEEAEKKRVEDELKQQMAREDERLAAEQRARNSARYARERERYTAAIVSAINARWHRPPGSARDFVCKVLVKQIPSGDVIDVRVVESCGSPILDSSVASAVRDASPLPRPASPELFDRELEITFVPN
ncbi:MAG: cell envelope integrity protein TolA [Chromatiales bacterium]|nr:cell envelope integrity protein TolA [Chromatiales bacterium]